MQLLDLLDALYSKVGQIFDEKTVENIQTKLNAASQLSVNEKQSGRFGSVSDMSMDSLRSSSSSYPAMSGCGLTWRLAWCPILQGKGLVVVAKSRGHIQANNKE